MKKISRTTGFTLIELMIAVAIVGILATVAVESYRSAILRSNRTDAKAVLLNIQVAQEKTFLQYNRYAQNNTELAGASSNTTPGLSIPTTTTGGRYTVALTSTTGGASDYTATATAIGGQLNDTSCRTFTIDNLGTRQSFTSGGVISTTCWAR